MTTTLPRSGPATDAPASPASDASRAGDLVDRFIVRITTTEDPGVGSAPGTTVDDHDPAAVGRRILAAYRDRSRPGREG